MWTFCEFIPQSLALMDKIRHQSPALEHIEIGLFDTKIDSNGIFYIKVALKASDYW